MQAVLINGNVNNGPVVTAPTGSGTGSDTTTGTTTSTGVPAYSFDIHTAGYVSVSFNVQARNLLKVKFTPGKQDRTIAGTGASPQYSGLGVYITVGSLTQPTPLLYNGYYGGNAESTTFDFSNQYARTCSSTDPSCRETVTVTVSRPNYDYWCINFGYACPWNRVSDNHPWNGVLQVQTDDTDAF